MSTRSLKVGKCTRGLWIATLGVALSGTSGAVVSLKITPAATTVQLGQQFTVDLVADGASAGIGAWDFVMTYSTPGLISVANTSFSNALGVIGTEAVSFTGVDFGVVSFLPSAELIARQQSQPFTLATLTFNAVARGVTQLGLAAPALGAILADAAGQAIVPTITGASVSVVPEPATVALLLSGLGCLLGRVRQMRSGSTFAGNRGGFV